MYHFPLRLYAFTCQLSRVLCPSFAAAPASETPPFDECRATVVCPLFNYDGHEPKMLRKLRKFTTTRLPLNFTYQVFQSRRTVATMSNLLKVSAKVALVQLASGLSSFRQLLCKANRGNKGPTNRKTSPMLEIRS